IRSFILLWQFSSSVIDLSVTIYCFQKIGGTDIGSHDQDGVLKVYGPALGVCDPSVVQYLEQYVEHIRMGLLNLIKKDYRIGFSSYGFCKLSPFFISYISRRRSDQSGHRVFLHIFTHINTDHVLLVIKKCGGQSLSQLCLTYTGRSKEQEGTDRLGRILNTGFGTDNSVCYLCNAFVLSDHPFMKLLFQVKDLGTLPFRKFRHRDSRPPGNDPGNLIFCNALMNHRQILVLSFFLLCFQLFLQLGQFPVLKPCSLIQIILSLSFLDLIVHILNLFSQLLEMFYCNLFIIPLGFLSVEFIFQLCHLFLKLYQTVLAETVIFFLKG